MNEDIMRQAGFNMNADKIREAIANIKTNFDYIQKETKAYSMMHSATGTFEIQTNKRAFAELCKAFNVIPCIEQRKSNLYPYEKYFYVEGVKFFTLVETKNGEVALDERESKQSA